jgi:hypothetical protein
MADNSLEAEKLKLIRLQNEQLKEQIKLLQETGEMSSRYITRLNEINKIKEKLTKTEETSYDLIKKMQNSLREYNGELETSKNIEEQLNRSKELINKALEKQQTLREKITQSTNTDNSLVKQVGENRNKLLGYEAKLTEELAKNKKEQNNKEIKFLQEKIKNNKADTENKVAAMSADARHLIMLGEQIEAKKKQIENDEKSLGIAKEKEEVEAKSIAAKKEQQAIDEETAEAAKKQLEQQEKNKTVLASIASLIFTAFNKLDKAQTDFQRQTGKTVEYSNAIASTIGTGMISMGDYIKTATDLTKQLGSNAESIFSPKTIGEASQLVNSMGLAVDEANNLAILSRTARVEMDKQDDAIIANVDNFNKFNRTAFTGAQIMKDVAKTSAATTVSLGFSAEKIAQANLEARKLGLSLDQVDKIAESLLNFEQSISSELEAELLTGKNINLETARLLALNNDLEGVAKELGKNQELLNSYINGNRIQQESIAKAMGMNREEMGKMIMSQKTQLGLTDEQVQKASGLSKEDFRRLTLQENINKSIEKMTEILAGPLEVLAKLVNFMNQFYGVWILIGAVGIASAVNGMAKLIQSAKILKLETLATAAAWIVANPGKALIGAAVAAGIIYGIKALVVGDINSPADGKTRVSTKEGGLFELSPNDDLIAAPGISKLAATKSSTTVMANNNAELLNKMDEFIKKQDQSNEVLRGIHKSQPREFALNLETSKFGTAINTTSYKTK